MFSAFLEDYSFLPFEAKEGMWSSSFPTNISARELLEHCFLSPVFNLQYHARCGHASVSLLPPESLSARSWKLTVRFVVSMVADGAPNLLRSLVGGLSADVEQVTLVELTDDGVLLKASASSKIASGPGARLQSSASWELGSGSMQLTARVQYQPSGFADRLIASSVEGAASGKARESLELWWKLAQEAVARSREEVAARVAAPGVQRALSFDEAESPGTSEQIQEEDEDDDEESGGGGAAFFDASSVFETSSPSLSSTSGMLELLEREAQGLQAEVKSLELQREQL